MPILSCIGVSYTIGKLLNPPFHWPEVRKCVTAYLLPASLHLVAIPACGFWIEIKFKDYPPSPISLHRYIEFWQCTGLHTQKALGIKIKYVITPHISHMMGVIVLASSVCACHCVRHPAEQTHIQTVNLAWMSSGRMFRSRS